MPFTFTSSIGTHIVIDFVVLFGVLTVMTVVPDLPPSTNLPFASIVAISGLDEVKLSPLKKL